MAGSILIVDDEQKLGELLTRSLQRSNYSAEYVRDPIEALERLKGGGFDVLLTDLRMPGIDGLEVLIRAKAINPAIEVILMTAFATVDTAREALKRGAVDYLVKPFSADEQLKPLLESLLSTAQESPRKPESQSAASAPPPKHAPKSSVFRSQTPAMVDLYAKVEKIARSTANVLLRGESGTGKEVLAGMIQEAGPRAGKPFVKVNCGAISESLLESELFGHVRGSFTGAHADREGHFKSADGGTILLDEVGEVSPALQVKLLRVLQNGEMTAVGDSRSIKVDVRVIAATNRPLEEMIKAGTFREDLYYRLNVVPLTLPPLRQRTEDIPGLIEYFARKFGGNTKVVFSPAANEAMCSYSWPGNIRELENAVEHAIVLGEPSGIELADLPVAIQDFARKRGEFPTQSAVGAATLEEIEKRCLMTALEKTEGNRTRASRLLGITRRTLGYRLKKYGLEEQANRLGGGDE